MSTPPVVLVKTVGDISTVNVDVLQESINANPDNILMTLILKGFQTAFKFQDIIISSGMNYVVADLVLSVLPAISPDFVKESAV